MPNAYCTNYLLIRSNKSSADLFDAAEQMYTETSTVKSAQMSRMEILEEASEKEAYTIGIGFNILPNHSLAMASILWYFSITFATCSPVRAKR